MKRVLSNENGRVETFHLDNDGTATIQHQTDVSGILKANKFQRDHAGRYTSEAFNHKARIPVDIAKQWCKQQGVKYSEFMANPRILKRFLNDPDNGVWLTRKGRV